jgi:hypothetical protein
MGFFANRRNKIIDSQIRQMIQHGISEADVPSLYFEAACAYAQENGGKLYADQLSDGSWTRPDSIIFDKEIAGENYSIFFLVGRGGTGTNITLTKRRSSYDTAKEEMDEFVGKTNGRTIRQLVLESLNKKKAVKYRPVVEHDIHRFFESYSTSIPSKWMKDEASLVRVGLVEMPSSGIFGPLVVWAALINDEATIGVGDASTWGNLSANRDAILQWQEKQLQEFRSVVLAEIKDEAKKLVRKDGAEKIREVALQSFTKKRAVRYRPAVENDIQSFFEYYSTIIPSKWLKEESSLVRLGFVDIPGTGILVVMAALKNDIALIHVPGAAPSEILSPAKRDGILELQEEQFKEFRSGILSFDFAKEEIEEFEGGRRSANLS